MKSKREDGRGHYPPGQHRHADVTRWSAVLIRLRRLLETRREHGAVSRRAMAAAVGVSEGAVRKWLSGSSRPAEETQRAVVQWMNDVS